MCGIFGYFDKNKVMKKTQSTRLARSLARVAQSRGSDASGYAIASSSGTLSITKAAVPASQLSYDSTGSAILIGHTRFATMGDPSLDSQAHPFQSIDGRYALTHNGVGTFDFHRLQEQFGLDAQIDSEGMLRYLEMKGFDEQGLRSFYEDWSNSGFAISMIDAVKQSLILFRNEINPLIMVKTKENVLVYGSTKNIVLTGCVSAELTPSSLISIKPGYRYEFNVSDHPKVSDLLNAA